MPPGSDRYQPLRDAAHEAQNQVEHREAQQEETKRGPHERRAADAHAAQDLEAEIAENGPTRPTAAPNRSPGWTDSPRIEDQQHSANQYNTWVNASHGRRPPVPQQAEQDQQKPQEEKSPRTHADLKKEHSQTQKTAEQSEQVKDAAKSAEAKKPALTFNWDREQGHEHER